MISRGERTTLTRATYIWTRPRNQHKLVYADLLTEPNEMPPDHLHWKLPFPWMIAAGGTDLNAFSESLPHDVEYVENSGEELLSSY